MDSPALGVIRRTYDAFNAGRPDLAAAELPEEFVIVPLPATGLPALLEGPEGITRLYADAAETWEGSRIDLDEVIDLGDRVVVPVRVELIGDREEALRRGRAEASS